MEGGVVLYPLIEKGIEMVEQITGREIAAAVLVGMGLASENEVGLKLSEGQSYLRRRGEAIARGLNFKPREEKAAVIARCRELVRAR